VLEIERLPQISILVNLAQQKNRSHIPDPKEEAYHPGEAPQSL
jgi:hypothetical protein